MKMKKLLVIFIILLAITLGSGAVVFLIQEKNQPVASEQANLAEKQVEPVKATATVPKKNITPQAPPPQQAEGETGLVKGEKNTETPQKVNRLVEEKIKAVMIMGGAKYEAKVKINSSVYDLMDLLKTENKIDFSGKNYSGLGFFVEEISGLKNNSAGKNWLYYINGRPAQVGISNYLIKTNDIIEWKYEEKSF